MRAKVDQHLDWAHWWLRYGSNRLVFLSYFLDIRKIKMPEDQKRSELALAEEKVEASLNFLESKLNDQLFLAAPHDMTLADLSAICDLT